MTKPKSPTPATARQTSDRVSSMAGELLAIAGKGGRFCVITQKGYAFEVRGVDAQARSVFASALNQDQHPGLRTPKPRKAKRAKGKR